MESRLITLSDGTTMADELIVIRTDAPRKVLEQIKEHYCIDNQ